MGERLREGFDPTKESLILMVNSARILLMDEQVDVESLKFREKDGYKAIIGLFWMAPSTKRFLWDALGGSCYGLDDIVRTDGNWEEEAYRLALQTVREGPSHGHLPWRSYLMAPLYEEYHVLPLARKTAYFVDRLRRQWSVESLEIDSALKASSDFLFAQVFREHPQLVYHSARQTITGPGALGDRETFIRRVGRRMREARLTKDWKTQSMDFIEALDKTYRWRVRWGRWRERQTVAQRGITFFSSYVNNSRTLSWFIDDMPGPVTWIVSNDSARRGLPRSKCNYSWLWEFAGSPISVPEDKGQNNGEGTNEGPLSRQWLTVSPTWQSWKRAELSLLASLTHCWETYLDRAAPSLVVMANAWSLEGWFTEIARSRDIPVLQIMHGVLGGYLYTQTPIASDAMVVPGEFWRNLWPQNQRHKIIAFNPNRDRVKSPRGERHGKKRVTFFSWPLASLSFYNFQELTEGFMRLFHGLVSTGAVEVVVRVHPQENPSDFTIRWKQLYGSLPRGIWIDKKKSLGEILDETDVALMFRSTVMLDCMANGIPIVTPGWIDFGWNEALVDVPTVYVAHDFIDLEQRVRAWLEHPPIISPEAVDHFVRSPDADRTSFLSLINDLVSRDHASGRRTLSMDAAAGRGERKT
jgi:hypothetical protein